MKLNIYNYTSTNVLNDNLTEFILHKQNFSKHYSNNIIILKK